MNDPLFACSPGGDEAQRRPDLAGLICRRASDFTPQLPPVRLRSAPSARKLAGSAAAILVLKGDLTAHNFNEEILIPELLDLGQELVVPTYPRELHLLAFYTPARTPRPAVAANAFEEVNALARRHLPTSRRPSTRA